MEWSKFLNAVYMEGWVGSCCFLVVRAPILFLVLHCSERRDDFLLFCVEESMEMQNFYGSGEFSNFLPL